MKTTTISKIMMGALLLVSLAGCKKGDTGPAGANGANGNANVKSQSNTNLTWTFNTATKVFETNIAVATITQDIVDKGAVFVYYQDGGTSSQLPSSAMYDANTIVFFDFVYSVGNVKITFANSELDNSLVPQSTLKFKIVTMSATARQAHPELKSYTEIKTAYNLSE